MRICEMSSGGVITEIAFPEALEVTDTQYDKASGNLAVIYKDAFRLYSGTDGKILAERTDAESVIYTNFGVIVSDKSGKAVLYDLETGSPANYTLLFDSEKIIGAGKIGEDRFGFAVYDGSICEIYTVDSGSAVKKFECGLLGAAEVYFTSAYIFISPRHGDAEVYDLNGRFIRVLEEKGHMSETDIITAQAPLSDYIAAGYVSMSGERYSLLLAGDSLETVLELRGFLGGTDAGTIILNDGGGKLRTSRIYTTEELILAAKEYLNGRTLTDGERLRFKTR
jgi:hypothetical protein